VIASDVAYDPALTQAFFCSLRELLLAAAPRAVAVVALERRVNFSASLCDVVALDADVFADVTPAAAARAAAHSAAQFAAGCGCAPDGTLLSGFSGHKVQYARCLISAAHTHAFAAGREQRAAVPVRADRQRALPLALRVVGNHAQAASVMDVKHSTA
jgi:hypothetical protein